jgi:hypothetical protein
MKQSVNSVRSFAAISVPLRSTEDFRCHPSRKPLDLRIIILDFNRKERKDLRKVRKVFNRLTLFPNNRINE